MMRYNNHTHKHSHKCPYDGTVWTHQLPESCTERDHEEAHKCPKCGKPQYEKHYRNRQEMCEAKKAFFDNLRKQWCCTPRCHAHPHHKRRIRTQPIADGILGDYLTGEDFE